MDLQFGVVFDQVYHDFTRVRVDEHDRRKEENAIDVFLIVRGIWGVSPLTLPSPLKGRGFQRVADGVVVLWLNGLLVFGYQLVNLMVRCGLE